MCGLSTFLQCELTKLGKIKILKKRDAGGRILRVLDDQQHGMGILFMSDKAKFPDDFLVTGENGFNTFNLRELPGQELTLRFYKMGEFYEAASSMLDPVVSYDCEFNLFKADKNMMKINVEGEKVDDN